MPVLYPFQTVTGSLRAAAEARGRLGPLPRRAERLARLTFALASGSFGAQARFESYCCSTKPKLGETKRGGSSAGSARTSCFARHRLLASTASDGLATAHDAAKAPFFGHRTDRRAAQAPAHARPAHHLGRAARWQERRFSRQRCVPFSPSELSSEADGAPAGNTGLPAVLEVEKFAQVRLVLISSSSSHSACPRADLCHARQARVFEITAMKRAMKSAKCVLASLLSLSPAVKLTLDLSSACREAGTQRAFQSLPRHLRRRAASHNIRRLPARLRERARGEVRPSLPDRLSTQAGS